MKKLKPIVIILINVLFSVLLPAQNNINPENTKVWKLMFSDDFNYKNRDDLLKIWESQNGPSNHILCSRWKENIELGNGTLKLVNKKENRGGQNWTSGNIWTREKFKYGYFECRYKYASAPATNNSFWLMTKGSDPSEGKRFEIDINEGHYPNKLNTNIHNWTDITTNETGKKTHPTFSKSFSFGVEPAYTYQLETPVEAYKIRYVSNNPGRIHIGEFRIFTVNAMGYPSKPLENHVNKMVEGLVNLSELPSVRLSVSGTYQNNEEKYGKKNLIDDNNNTRWISQEDGEKWIEFQFDKKQTIGCIQFTNGWDDHSSWRNLVSDFKIEYWDGKKWTLIGSLGRDGLNVDFSRDFHTYGLEWSDKELVYYLDRKEIRREKNQFCFSESPVWLSLAIIPWDGPVTDKIDGTQMEIDYVRVYQKKQ